MIPLKDDNPTEGRPVITYFLIGLCVLVFLMEAWFAVLQNWRTILFVWINPISFNGT